ncbi:hypothetical protein B0H11DRAFT_2255827 [Mycena galericulata]|nr:hypothetical protein B0H11DRAFT_2255827 [Mycena galericulata]
MEEQNRILDVALKAASAAKDPTQQQCSLNVFFDQNLGDTNDGAFQEHSTDCQGTIGRMSSATDFIRKLYKILSNQGLQDVIGWAPQRDRFVVKDMEEFRKLVLPSVFKHSNFASFVRQLNKYGFHKVKNFDDIGDNTWTFRHPDFHADHRDALEKIKRKAPVSPHKSSYPESTTSESSNPKIESLQTEVLCMRTQIASLGAVVREVLTNVRILERSHQEALLEMVAFQRGMAQRDKRMAGLVQCLLRDNNDNGNRPDELQGGVPTQGGTTSPSWDQIVSRQQLLTTDREEDEKSAVSAPSLDAWPASSPEEWGVVGRTRSEGFTDRPLDGNMVTGEPIGEESVFTNSSGTPPQTPTHVRRAAAMFMPRWVAPPHVLVVEDDIISRKLSSKFLQVFGCTIDFAVDGVDAVDKMAHDKYDLVLMDIVMPNLDGISATAIIRRFDQSTPIISMTSNSRPNQIMSYYSSGMNDILPKPFKKGLLLDILVKHLTHLTVIRQQMSSSSMCFSPFATGIPSPDSSLDYGLGSPDRGDGSISPLVDLGLDDDPYNDILSNIMTSNEFSLKRERALDEEDPGGHECKRARE